MATKLERQLAEAKIAIQNGEKKRARVLLSELIKSDKDNPDVWMWLSAVVETHKDRVYCLQQVIKLDENNEIARRGLATLGEAEYRQQLKIPIDNQIRDWEKTAGITRMSSLQQFFISGVWRPFAAIAGVVLVIGLLTLTGFGVKSLLTRPTSQFGILQTSTQKATATPPPHEYLFLNVDDLNSQTPLARLIELTTTPAPSRTPYVSLNYTQYEYNRSALYAYSKNDWENVIYNLEKLVDEEPDAFEALYYLGEAHRNLGEYQIAQDYYTATLELMPDFPPALLGTALAQYALDPTTWQSAITQIETAIELAPEYPDSYLAIATIYLEQEDIPKAQAALRIAKTQLPDEALVYLLMAKTYLAEIQPEKAIPELLMAQKLDGTNLETYRLLGETYFKIGEYDRALEPIRITIVYSDADTPELWAWLGYCYAHLDLDEQAQEAFDNADALEEDNATVSYYQGLFYFDNENYAEARPYIETAYTADRNSYQINLTLALIYKGTNLCGKSIHYFDRAETFATTDRELAPVYYHRGLCYVDLDYTTSALRDLHALLALPAALMPKEWRSVASENVEAIATATPTTTPTNTLTPTRTPRFSATPTKTLTKTASPTVTTTLPSTPTKTATATPTEQSD